MKDSVTTALNETHTRAPLAKIALLGYPQMMAPFDTSGGAVANCLLMPKSEADRLNQLVGVMNTGLCGSNPAFNSLVDNYTADENGKSPVGQQSLHPTKDGTTLYANALQDALGS